MKRSYTIEAQTEPLERADEALLEAVTDALAGDRNLTGSAPAVNTLTRVLSVRASCEASTPEGALATGMARIRLALKRAGVSAAGITEASVQSDLDEDEFASARDDLVGTPDVAARLGISRQRVAQLVDTPGRFPHPVATVRGTHVWRWGDVADWVAAGRRDTRRKRPDNTIDLIDALKTSTRRERPAKPSAPRPRRKTA